MMISWESGYFTSGFTIVIVEMFPGASEFRRKS